MEQRTRARRTRTTSCWGTRSREAPTASRCRAGHRLVRLKRSTPGLSSTGRWPHYEMIERGWAPLTSATALAALLARDRERRQTVHASRLALLHQAQLRRRQHLSFMMCALAAPLQNERKRLELRYKPRSSNLDALRSISLLLALATPSDLQKWLSGRHVPTTRKSIYFPPHCAIRPASPQMKARLQQTLRAYGRTAAAFHSCVFLATLSGSYAAIRAGADMDALLARVPFVDLSRVDREAGTLALAYVSTVATGPARGALTLAASPVLARLLARARRLK